jgi:hypothetical protein
VAAATKEGSSSVGEGFHPCPEIIGKLGTCKTVGADYSSGSRLHECKDGGDSVALDSVDINEGLNSGGNTDSRQFSVRDHAADIGITESVIDCDASVVYQDRGIGVVGDRSRLGQGQAGLSKTVWHPPLVVQSSKFVLPVVKLDIKCMFSKYVDKFVNVAKFRRAHKYMGVGCKLRLHFNSIRCL